MSLPSLEEIKINRPKTEQLTSHSVSHLVSKRMNAKLSFATELAEGSFHMILVSGFDRKSG